jgi:GNAT superfamily N-acetyltransferase
VSHRVEALGANHDLARFRCGKPWLDEWLHRHTRNAAGQGTRTYVLLAEPDDEVVGYFAIAPHLLGRADAPKAMVCGAPERIPAILLAKLALDARLHGRGLGGDLLVHALSTITAAARTAGGRIVVVDAIDEAAAAFYRAHDFREVPGNPHRLVIKLSTVAGALGVPWP